MFWAHGAFQGGEFGVGSAEHMTLMGEQIAHIWSMHSVSGA